MARLALQEEIGASLTADARMKQIPALFGEFGWRQALLNSGGASLRMLPHLGLHLD